MKVLMHALAASCEELRARTGNPPLRILFHRIQQHGTEDNLHVTEDRIQSLVRGMVGELFVPDNRPYAIGPGKISNLVPLKMIMK